MAARKFFHIFIVPAAGTSRTAIEKQMSKAKNWIRYGDNAYIVYTNSEPTRWKARLIDLVKPEGNLLIVELNIATRKGFMPTAFWKWVNEQQD